MGCQTMSGHIKLSYSGCLLFSQFQHDSLHGISRIRQFYLGGHGEFVQSHYSLEFVVITDEKKYLLWWTCRHFPNSMLMVYVCEIFS
ncbi:hypothetical protein BT93_D0177 [Corymbia citriodora subsp. variegata]|nr:hypothetical protein BT93_D0177 [Corymbia citriodora subsp. variegata]